jgi:hypothetical protein
MGEVLVLLVAFFVIAGAVLAVGVCQLIVNAWTGTTPKQREMRREAHRARSKGVRVDDQWNVHPADREAWKALLRVCGYCGKDCSDNPCSGRRRVIENLVHEELRRLGHGVRDTR